MNNKEMLEMECKRNLTIPILRWDEKRPRIGLSVGASFDFAALGGISYFSLFFVFKLDIIDWVINHEGGKLQ